MPATQNPSNFHHFTPKSVLRRFSQRGQGRQVAVFDKTTGRSWTTGLRETGSGQGYNTLVQPDGSELNFEADFDAIDAAYAEVGDALTARRDISGLDPDFKLKLADATAVQVLRTPIVRSTLTLGARLCRRIAGQRVFGLRRAQSPRQRRALVDARDDRGPRPHSRGVAGQGPNTL